MLSPQLERPPFFLGKPIFLTNPAARTMIVAELYPQYPYDLADMVSLDERRDLTKDKSACETGYEAIHDVLNVFMCTGFTRDTHQYF
jgi:hypothetical protein